MRLSKEPEAKGQCLAQSRCCHCWIIDCSDESVSTGYGELCGEQRDFQHRASSPSDRGGGTVRAVERYNLF
jgi:hypothetical protein